MPFTATSAVYGTNFAASSQLIATEPISTTGHHRYVANGTSSYESVFANDTPTSAANKLRFVYPGKLVSAIISAPTATSTWTTVSPKTSVLSRART